MKARAYPVFVLVLSIVVSLKSGAVPAEGTKVMVAGPSPQAVEVGRAVAEEGGNVVDVAVAMGLTLTVTSPYFGALGGGGFALIKMDKEVIALDFREVAPKATSPTFYVERGKDSSITGGAAVGVPGFPAGLWEMHKKYGKLPWGRLFKGPMQLAQQGFRVSGEWHRKTVESEPRFNAGGKKSFFKKDGKPYLPGEVLQQKALGQALNLFRSKNVKGFYSGEVARDIVDTVKRTGGVIELEDLAAYKVRWLKPLETQFKGYQVYLMPPPSSGGVVIKSALNLIEQVQLEKLAPFSVDELHVFGEVLSRSFRGRALLGDPDFHKNPLERLLSEGYLKEMAKSISAKSSSKLDPLSEDAPADSANTTHYSVLDSEGRSVALTVTLNGNYGSAVVSDKFGIALNNEMDDFTTQPNEPNMYGLIQGKGNLVQPGKRPLSSMSPTLVEKDGKVVLSVGSPGGPRIISGVIQVLYRNLVNGLNMDQAIQAPRIHHQFLPHKLFIDTSRFAPETISGLKTKKHEVEESWMGRVYGVRLTDKGVLEAAHDARGEGASGGY